MTDKLIPLKIAGIGYSVPKTVITNEDLTKLYETSDEWIYTRTGIKERRVVSGNETAIDLGFDAAKKAIEKSGIDVNDIDCIIVAVSHDYFKKLSLEKMLTLYKDVPNDQKVLVDVKGMFNISELRNSGINWWRL